MSRNNYPFLRKIVSRVIEGRKEYRRLQAAMTDIIQIAAQQSEIQTMLDIGCGEGGYTIRNAQAINLPLDKVYGVDFNPETLKSANEKFTTRSVDLEKDPLPFPDGSMDLVICNQVLEHMKNLFWILSEMDRVLAVEGVMVIGVPNLTSLLNRFILMGGWQPITIGIEGPHVRGFAHWGLRSFLQRHKGYQLIAERGSSFYPFPAKLGAEQLAKHFPGLSAYMFYAFVKREIIIPCPWLRFGIDGQTSYTHFVSNQTD